MLVQTLGNESISLVRPHETFVVQSGGGTIQHVPFNITQQNVENLGAIDPYQKGQLAAQLVTHSKNGSLIDVQRLLGMITDAKERHDIALYAIAIGGDPTMINSALDYVNKYDNARIAAKLAAKPLISKPFAIAWGVAATASFVASVFHGYRRNNSVGWALWWGLMGSLFPVVTPTIAIAQGYAKPKRQTLGYRRRRRTNRR